MSTLQWRIGEVRVTRVLENEANFPPQGLLPEATPEALASHEAWLRPHFLGEDGHFTLAIQGLVIEAGGRKILVDTCMGDRPQPIELAESPGDRFLRNMDAAGFPRDAIDTVLCTHLHFDHVGWNTMREGDRWVPTFPNAEYLFARVEFEHWQSETAAGRGQEFAGTFGDAVQPVFDAGLATLVDTDHKLCDEVWLEPTPGHTPGHVAVRIGSLGEHAMITGDLTHHPVQWAEVDWKMPADSDSAEAASTRRRLLAEHADTSLLVIGTHYAAPTAGHLVRDGDSHRFVGLRDPE